MIVRPIGVYSLRHPDGPEGHAVVTNPGQTYQADDPLVKAHRWAFQSDSEIEQATAAPGEKRNVRKP